MNRVILLDPENREMDFIPGQYLPKGQDEYYIRNEQMPEPRESWRHLTSDEIQRLSENGNTSDNWENICVTGTFDTRLIRNSRFQGLVRIGRIEPVVLQHEALKVSAGITNSLIISCDIGNDVAIHDVSYLSHYIIGDKNILFQIGEMTTNSHAKFGNGILKDGEPESARDWMEIMNESGARKILPFDGMLPADAWLWGKYRDDLDLQKKLVEITQKSVDIRHGIYGTTGGQCVIKNTLTLTDVKMGSGCTIQGALVLNNLTIHSSLDEPTQIGEGVQLVNGIVGYGCHIYFGSMADHFMMGCHSSLKYGARLLHTFLGDNSTISCCEVLNNLIFPAHEQHHNNSFLIATVIMGQSNIAAGATIGSNHNSRANDNEVQAGRGFWPGLCTSIKHSSRFASFTLLAKADYPSELNISLPFSLVNNNAAANQLEVMPAYWWVYNMYALMRNTRKVSDRDKRINGLQHIEADAFAPDTMEEVIISLQLLEIWTAKAFLKQQNKVSDGFPHSELAKQGKTLLLGDNMQSLEVIGENLEHGRRKTIIVKPQAAYRAYREMLLYYATQNIVRYLNENPDARFQQLHNDLKGERKTKWTNFGGQILPENDIIRLRKDIGTGLLHSWEDIHKQYDLLWQQYPREKQKHAYGVLLFLQGTDSVTLDELKDALSMGITLRQFVSDQVYASRKKDFDNPFFKSTFRNPEEMKAVVGTPEDNTFIIREKEETILFKKGAEAILQRF